MTNQFNDSIHSQRSEIIIIASLASLDVYVTFVIADGDGGEDVALARTRKKLV